MNFKSAAVILALFSLTGADRVPSVTRVTAPSVSTPRVADQPQCAGGFVPCPTRSLCAVFPSDCGTACPALSTSQPRGDSARAYVCPDRTTCSPDASSFPTACAASVSGSVWDATLPVGARVGALVSSLTSQEKIAQLTDKAPSIERFSVPSFNWLNDDEHGVKQGQGTSFPNGVTLGQTWDREFLGAIGRAVSVEARGIFNADVAAGNRGVGPASNGIGTTLYAPNLNLVRNPLWGRAQEVLSEDPVLTGELTEVFVNGIQMDKAGRVLGLACCKHYAAYDLEGPNPTTRFNFSANVDARNMLESYLPGFEHCVRRAGGKSVMCSYNSINGVPTCGDPKLLNGLLRTGLAFDGFVVSDYDAWANMVSTHHYVDNLADAAKVGIEAGMDQEGGGTAAIDQLWNLVNTGVVAESAIDLAVTRLFRARVDLGLFDPPALNPFAGIFNDSQTVASPAHLELAFESAAGGIVLHYNNATGAGAGAAPILPINDHYARLPRVRTSGRPDPRLRGVPLAEDGTASTRSLCVVGPQANMTTLLQGNYAVPPIRPIETILEALGQLYPSVRYAQGCATVTCPGGVDTAAIAAACSSADVAIVTLGLDQTVERETLDRSTLALPANQINLVNAVRAALPASNPIVGVLIRGGTVLVDESLRSQIGALIDAGYPGERGGAAVAAVIAGVRNPSGRTAVTYYGSDDDLPPIGNSDFYAAPGVTYRYSTRDPTFAFGTGQSYTTFNLGNVSIDSASVDACAPTTVAFEVSNTGRVDGSVVVQAYARQIGFNQKTPIVRLADFGKYSVKSGASASAKLAVGPRSRFFVNDGGSIYDLGEAWVSPGTVEIIVSLQGPFDPSAVRFNTTITGNLYRLEECG